MKKKGYDFSAATRGAIDPTPAGKTRITIRLDEDLIDWFRQRADEAGGGNYQTAINHALREYIARVSLEEVLRRVVREELLKAA
jgi:uncharacterized protein (DUF4415 family)